MNILFIGYWGVNEGLSVATIDPHLEILSRFSEVEKIIYVSIERDQGTLRSFRIAKVQHVPYYSGRSAISKFKDYVQLPRYLAALCHQYQIDIIICRSAPAGALGYLVWKRNKIPFCVESFEPHADYMLESGVWSRLSFYYLLSKYWERKQKEHAILLVPVAHNYAQQLAKEGVEEERVSVVPCTVDLKKFQFSAKQRARLRKELDISNDVIVGIYVGKYGGIYMDEEAFRIYQEAFRYWQDFFLIVLSPREHHSHIRNRIKEFNLPENRVLIQAALHQEVPKYLSAAEFAFATYKPGISKAFLSPIKIGEYWANGLPVVLTEGVGDDALIINEKEVGELIREQPSGFFFTSYSTIQELINQEGYRERIQQVAQKYRNRRVVKHTYSYLIKQHYENYAGVH